MFPLLVLLLLLFTSCINTAASNGSENGFNNGMSHCIQNERQALLSFKAGLVDDHDVLSSWSNEEGNKDCCNWWGVTCSYQTGRIINLHLPTFNYVRRLRGNISSSLLELRELEYLDLSSNDFGYMPIPDFFGSFSKLKYLYLSNSSLAGTIPSQLGNLSNLILLDLSYNLLDGMIPQSLGNLCNLESLLLSNSNLAGTIPSQLGNLPNLTRLHLSSNLLDGMIPDSLGNLCNLQHLDLKNNSLTGNLSFVDNLSRCSAVPALKWLSLSANQHNGTLTKNLGTLSNLKYLDLSSNSLSGIVSEAHLSNLSYLHHLDLSRNYLDFKISPQWVPPFQLSYIRLKSCNLGPSFPQWIRNQTRIYHLDISNTGISKSIPSWFWDTHTIITYLNLSSNNIGGILPDLSSKFDRFPTNIDLSSNNFEGQIPPLPSRLANIKSL